MTLPMRAEFTFTPQPLTTGLQVYLVEGEASPAGVEAGVLKSAGFKGVRGQSLWLPERGVVLVGCGPDPKAMTNTTDPYRTLTPLELGAQTYQAVAQNKHPQVVLMSVPSTWRGRESGELSGKLGEFLLGFLQTGTNLHTYKETDTKERVIGLTQALANEFREADQAALTAYTRGLSLTRYIVEETPETMHPESASKLIEREFKEAPGASVTITKSAELVELGAHALLAVGRAGRYETRVTKVVLEPSGLVERTVCLVGKGVTYDSGGYDIKTGGHMHTMKTDLGGAATMAGVMRTLASLPQEYALSSTRVIWYTGWVENLINESAYKSDDILTSLSGQTIEVWNTDAEGRLTLADVLTMATLDNPDYIVDAATLTGACVVAVSEHYTALMGNDLELQNQITNAFGNSGEKIQPLQMSESLREQVHGTLGDLRNTGKARYAGHVTAGLFLSHFVDQTQYRTVARERLGITDPRPYAWAHLDIAGSSYNEGSNPLGLKGATGHGVRGLVAWLQGLEK